MPIPLKFTTSLDDSNFNRGIASMMASASAFGSAILKATAVTGFARLTHSAIENASAIHDAALNANIGAEAYQRLQFALSQGGVGATKFTTGMQSLAQSVASALEGSEKQLAAFQKFGITLADLEGKKPDQILLRMSDAMKESGDSTELLSARIDILGRAGKVMGAAMSEGGEAIEQLGASARIVSERDLKLLEQMGDQIGRTWQGLKATFATGLAGLIRGPFDSAAGPEAELEAQRRGIAEVARMEAERAADEVSRAKEREDAKEREWQKALERADVLYKHETAQRKEAADNHARWMKVQEQQEADHTKFLFDEFDKRAQRGQDVSEAIAKAVADATKDAFDKALDEAKGKAGAAREAQQQAQAKLERDTGEAVRAGLQSPAERRAEKMAEKREQRELNRLNRILAEPEKRIGGKTGDAERAKQLAADRRNVNAANNAVTLADKSVKDLVDAIEKLIAK